MSITLLCTIYMSHMKYHNDDQGDDDDGNNEHADWEGDNLALKMVCFIQYVSIQYIVECS